VDVLAKLGMKRKKKWAVEGQIKRTNWKQVPVGKLTEKAFWTGVDEERLASQSLIEDLQNRFSSKPPGKKIFRRFWVQFWNWKEENERAQGAGCQSSTEPFSHPWRSS